jgi:hypothetical protein
MEPVQRRRDLERDGRNEYDFPRQTVRSKRDLTRVRRGLYITGAVSDADAWRAQLSAQLLQSGPGAVVGYRSAARLHGLDGCATTNRVETVTAQNHHARSGGIYRTRNLPQTDVCLIGGYPTTTLARTLLDLGRILTAFELELAVESALRGPNPGKPAEWNRALLDELWLRVSPIRSKTGAALLHRILRQRPTGCRPTGSYAEAEYLFGIRPFGFGEIWRQSDVRIFNPDGNLERWLYPDFMLPLRLLIAEINGAGSRGGATMTQGDVARMNVLLRAFRVHVVAASDAGKRRAASEFSSLALNQPEREFPLVTKTHTYLLTATGMDIHQHR